MLVCNFVNMVGINLVIHLVKYFYTLLSLQISPIQGIKNEGLEVVRIPPNPSKSLLSSLKKHSNKVIQPTLPPSTPPPSKQAINPMVHFMSCSSATRHPQPTPSSSHSAFFIVLLCQFRTKDLSQSHLFTTYIHWAPRGYK